MFVRDLPLAVALLLPAGAGWLAVLSTLGAATQVFLPSWVRARGLSVQQIVFMGGQAVGALDWGVAANYTGLVPVFVTASALMVLGAAASVIWPPFDTERLDRTAAVYRPEPQLMVEPDRDEWPVLITVTFTVPPEDTRLFIQAMQRVQASHRRDAMEPLPGRSRSGPPSGDVPGALLGGAPPAAQRTAHGTDQDIEREALQLASGPPETRTCSALGSASRDRLPPPHGLVRFA